ncbi:phosphotransacetylase family protein [Synechococcus lacustris]|uniref:phosphotransacetylase family protein n=1 Tax=Synechococcus lacustris TaxID=2116544 RepID=UPI0020CDD916|nr:phosphotransacetylase family protein [Synechococcus lacustris]MCP9795387.1 phosphotransacetylase family protein [Synechococcus lacustris L1F-Slac]
MGYPSATLLVGSCEPFSGKSALVMGLAQQFRNRGLPFRYGKPLATSLEQQGQSETLIDDDVRFVGEFFSLPETALLPSLQAIAAPTAQQQLLTGEQVAAPQAMAALAELIGVAEGITLLEAAGSLSEGLLFGLSLPQLALGLAAPVLIAHAWEDARSVEALLQAKALLGDQLLGVVLNNVDPNQIGLLRQELVPAMEALGLPVYGLLPRSPLLRSVTVGELVQRLGAEMLCCRERKDLLVETLSIGAMNVNSAMEFFRRQRNMAVVTGADRTDIQLAALEASTQCLILTGAADPLPQLISRAQELDVPLIKVEHDTLTTVAVIEKAFGHVRLHEPVKASYAARMVAEHCSFEQLFERLGF